jgi:hypothetical protein
MNKKILLIIALIALSLPAAAQVRLGLRGGVTVGELRFNRNAISSDNRMGYCAGVVVDMGIPVIGLGIEASAMYTHRNNRLTDGQRTFKRHYIDVPVYARFKLPITGLQDVFAPIAFTGPTFSVLFSDNAPDNCENNKTYLSWDVGLGADLFKHLRLTATYGIGISKALSYVDRQYTGDKIEGKDRHWTLNAAWLF